MCSETSMIAQQCRLQEWAAQIRDCQNRPAGMSVVRWCTDQGITKANDYYRLRRVRKALLERIPLEMRAGQIVRVESEFLQQKENTGGKASTGLDITINNCCVHVRETTSMQLLTAVVEVLGRAE